MTPLPARCASVSSVPLGCRQLDVKEACKNGLSTPCPVYARAGRLLLFKKYVIT